MEIRRIGTRVVYDNPWMTVREDDVLLTDGTPAVFGIVVKPDFAVVLPRGEGGWWMVQQHRIAVGRRVWEFPAGGWPPGVTGEPLGLAQRELAEETGLAASVWEHLGRLVQAPGYSTQEFDVWLAGDLTEGVPDREQSEQDMVHRFVTDEELPEMVRCGDIADATSLAALSLMDFRRA